MQKRNQKGQDMLTAEDIQLLCKVSIVLSDAKRIWPASHPAASMVRGLQEECDRVYRELGELQEELATALSRPASETSTLAAVSDDFLNAK
jgi:hypothetical protein